MTGLPFEIFVDGCFAPGCVAVEFRDKPRPTTPDLEALITAEWDVQCTEAVRHDRHLFNGTMLRYLSHTVTPDAPGRPGRFALTVGLTNYRDFIGTNLFNHRRLGEYGWDCFANPIGTTATIRTAEGLICYGRRSMKVGYHGGHVHTFGGALEPVDQHGDGRIDPFESVAREIHEELGIFRDELRDLTCVGMLRDREIYQPELLFEATVPMTFDEIRARWRDATARDEHIELVACRCAPDAIVPFLTESGPIAPVAIGALCLLGRRLWGDAWYSAAARALAT